MKILIACSGALKIIVQPSKIAYGLRTYTVIGTPLRSTLIIAISSYISYFP
jgi:hypothetical protein